MKDTLKDELAHYRQGPQAAPLSPKSGTSEKLAVIPERGFSAAAHSELPSGAILVLTFEEETLQRKDGVLWVCDARGSGLVGKFQNGVVVEGKVGKGLEFGLDMHNHYFKEGSFACPRTMAAWLKQQTGGGDYQAVLFYGNFGIVGGAVWKFDIGDIWISTRLKPDDAWHHHCVTYDGENLRYYFDGRVVAQRNKACEVIPGKFMIARNFVGVVDEVALFDRALSPNEVEQVYQLGVNGILLVANTKAESGPQNEPSTSDTQTPIPSRRQFP